jgi:SSS family solute:Na+ symporter
MWLVSMYGAGMIVMGLLLVPRILKLKFYTIPELLERRYGAPARVAGGIVMGCHDCMIVVVATIAVGAVAEVLMGVPRTEAILLCSAVMVGYSVMGGMWALTATDIVQFVIKTAGFLGVLLPLAIHRAGGLDAMQHALPPGFFSLTPHRLGQDRNVRHAVFYRHPDRAGRLAARVYGPQRQCCAHGRRARGTVLRRVRGCGRADWRGRTHVPAAARRRRP